MALISRRVVRGIVFASYLLLLLVVVTVPEANSLSQNFVSRIYFLPFPKSPLTLGRLWVVGMIVTTIVVWSQGW